MPARCSLNYLANCSMLFGEWPLLQRAGAARAAGFDAVEFWWPFDKAVPSDANVAAFISSIADAGVELVGLNFFGGELLGPDCGVLSNPDRSQEFRDSVDIAIGIADELNVSVLNALYGDRSSPVSTQAQDNLAIENLVLAAQAAHSVGATVLIEPISGRRGYPVRTAADVVTIIDRCHAVGAQNIGLLCDLYHLAANGADLDLVMSHYATRIAHVQIADFPGRAEPGSGTLDFDRYLIKLERAGYSGWVSLEYRPKESTLASLSWLPRARRGRQRPVTAGKKASND